MGLPRTFVGFSSTDIHCYRLMLAWKEHEHIDFNFVNCQLSQEIYSSDEAYIKRKCRERIDMAGTFAVLIGADTRSKHKYVCSGQLIPDTVLSFSSVFAGANPSLN